VWRGIHAALLSAIVPSAIVQIINEFAIPWEVSELMIADMVCCGTGLGVALSAGWAVIAVAMPAGLARRFAATVVGLDGIFKALWLWGNNLPHSLLLVVALILSFQWPDPPTGEISESFDSVPGILT
jgi:hypothetical protein